MAWIALLLGVVEGLTEFLPISSTGHLILVSHVVGFTGKRAEIFEVFIQLGAILAVVWEYRSRLWRVVRQLPSRPESRTFARNLVVAFLPAAGLGLLLHLVISDHLFTPGSAAAALITGGILILVVESLPLSARTREVDGISRAQAVLIGLAQCLALWPGFSRSAATILGGLAVGLDRRTATEFSFFLAIPTMFAATIYDLIIHHSWLEPGDLVWLALASAASFAVALVAIRWLLRYVAHHDLRPFAWYRLALGVLALLLLRR